MNSNSRNDPERTALKFVLMVGVMSVFADFTYEESQKSSLSRVG